MKVILIVAMDLNGVIGDGDKLPWKLKADLQHFKNTTLGRTIIAGRKTVESIGRKLPNRSTIMVSRTLSDHPWADQTCSTVRGAVEIAIQEAEWSKQDKCFIIGGAQIYKAALEEDLVDEIILTQVHTQLTGLTDPVTISISDLQNRFKLQVQSSHPHDDDNEYSFSILKGSRKCQLRENSIMINNNIIRKTEYIQVRTIGDIGNGNAYHHYCIEALAGDIVKDKYFTRINFQDGPIKDNGVNGVQMEELLAICQNRLEGFQSGPFACDTNQVALDHIKAAIASLDSRTQARKEQGVEGKMAVHTEEEPLLSLNELVDIFINNGIVDDWDTKAEKLRNEISYSARSQYGAPYHLLAVKFAKENGINTRKNNDDHTSN